MQGHNIRIVTIDLMLPSKALLQTLRDLIETKAPNPVS